MMNRKVIAIGRLKGTDVISRFEEVCTEWEVEKYIKQANRKLSANSKKRISVYKWDESKRDWVLFYRV